MKAHDLLLNYILHTDPSLNEQNLLEKGFSKENLEDAILIKTRLINLDTIRSELDRIKTEEYVEQNNFLKESRADTFEVIKDLKNSLRNTLKATNNSVLLAKIMFGLTFMLGFALIAASFYFGIKGQETLSIAFGTFGLGSIIAHLIADPPLKIQDSSSNYTQLTIGSLAWFNDFIDKSSMLSNVTALNQQIQQSGVDFETKILVQDKIINKFLDLSNAQMDNTLKVLRIIDEVAEPTKNKKKDEDEEKEKRPDNDNEKSS